MTPHQHRCETCAKFPAGSIFDVDCPQTKILSYNWDVPIDIWCEITSMIGCAYHSNAASGREQEIREEVIQKKFIDLIIEEMVYDDGDMYYKVNPEKYVNLLSELRKQVNINDAS